MSSNAALSAARRRRSNPLNAPAGTVSGPPPANRILQRMSGALPSHPQQQQHPQQQHPQARMATPQMQQQRGPLQQRGPPLQQQQQQQQQQMKRTQQMQQQQKSQIQSALPQLPPPNKNAGQLYGIPLHPLIMFQTHDNKLNEHDLSITECFDQLKEIEGRLIVVEGNGVNLTTAAAAPAAAPAGAASDLNELMNDGVFINGVVDNIMATTNFASIVENIVPLKEENEMLKQRISEQEIKSEQMYQFIQHLEERLRNIENELAQPYEEVSAPTTAVVEAAETAETVVEAAETVVETAETNDVTEPVS